MVREIRWSSIALVTFEEAVLYLERDFSELVSRKFADRVKQKMVLLMVYPRLGQKVGNKPNVYKTVINKRIVLYYQYKPRKGEILLLSFWNTLQNPQNLRIS